MKLGCRWVRYIPNYSDIFGIHIRIIFGYGYIFRYIFTVTDAYMIFIWELNINTYDYLDPNNFKIQIIIKMLIIFFFQLSFWCRLKF
jgi:hypothetical protein